ncbi:hypothetical protein SAMN04490357_0127 [Streptomyces misionensis]|uniref:Uncharacterized protein n=1 Tax=Streptomyces misionensis TaxID=67331 RepID=A0A1H4IAZ7_9ACTN|nr:DUF6059 family protein [Streptomyces misionensis]SEB31181.1 hypothetical protein SAMN04490357_0127 [Streptomyces misionensis]
MKRCWRRLGGVVVRLLATEGMQAVCVCLGGPVPLSWLSGPEADAAAPPLLGPPPLHPERVRADLPLTDLERWLERTLRAGPYPLRAADREAGEP